MKASPRAPLALLLATFTLPAAAQATRPAPTAPAAPGRAVIGANPQGPPGANPAQRQDVRVPDGTPTDPWYLERLGVAAVEKNELRKAREFFEESWKAGRAPDGALQPRLPRRPRGQARRPSDSWTARSPPD